MSEYNMIIGMDLGDRYNQFCVLDGAGEVVQEGRVACTELGLRKVFGTWEPSLFAIEAGTHSPWVSRVLGELGHTVLVGHPRKLRAVYTSERKSDVRDAEMLARIARMDPKLLYPIRHRGQQAQAHLALVKARACVVETRTKLVNHVRGTVKAFGERLPSSSAPAFHHKVKDAVPEELRAALTPVLGLIEQMSNMIIEYDRQLETLCAKKYPETELLRSVSGVGPVTALTYVLTLEQPDRFAKSRDVPSFLGLTPRRDQSGDTDRQLRITKTGNTYLRQLLVGCAQYIIGPFGVDSQLRQWGLRLAQRGGKNAKRRAVVAVARKLSVLLHRLWATGMLYEPFPDSPSQCPTAGATP
jgi:transposase